MELGSKIHLEFNRLPLDDKLTSNGIGHANARSLKTVLICTQSKDLSTTRIEQIGNKSIRKNP